VRFMDGLRWLEAQGVSTLLELGPDGVLSALASDCLPDVVAAPLLRRDRPEPSALLQGLAEVFVAGAWVDWSAVLAGAGSTRVRLPTYAFQRERYWLHSTGVAADVASIGQATDRHPLLGAAVALAGDRGWLFTGRLSLDSQPWLADHAVAGTVLLPGTALLELALHAGRYAGCGVVRELILKAPLVLDEQRAAALQVWVGEADEEGARPVDIYTSPDAARDAAEVEREWVCHASGKLSPVRADADGRVEPLASRVATRRRSLRRGGGTGCARSRRHRLRRASRRAGCSIPSGVEHGDARLRRGSPCRPAGAPAVLLRRRRVARARHLELARNG
jgi:acyl transferase domain-containing protein